MATRVVFALVAGHPILAPRTMLSTHDLLGFAAAGLTYLVVNNSLVTGVIALDSGRTLREVYRDDLRVQGLAWAILLALAPVTAVVADFSPVMLPLLVLPLLGVQHNAWISTQRQHESLHDYLTELPNRRCSSDGSTKPSPHTSASAASSGCSSLTSITSRKSTTRSATEWATASFARSPAG